MMDEFGDLYDHLSNYHPCSHRSSFQHAKKIHTIKKLKYILCLAKDYELTRRVNGTEKITT